MNEIYPTAAEYSQICIKKQNSFPVNESVLFVTVFYVCIHYSVKICKNA